MRLLLAGWVVGISLGMMGCDARFEDKYADGFRDGLKEGKVIGKMEARDNFNNSILYYSFRRDISSMTAENLIRRNGRDE